ncbi:hypothetical protein [Fischerella sp.]|nr:hypothetical protein [Fischerella sp.]
MQQWGKPSNALAQLHVKARLLGLKSLQAEEAGLVYVAAPFEGVGF